MDNCKSTALLECLCRRGSHHTAAVDAAIMGVRTRTRLKSNRPIQGALLFSAYVI